MESKYYTPTVDEFYIGFEFELKMIDWEKKVFDNSNFYKSYDNVEGCIIRKSIRVKYLDKEDIERLGFNTSEFQEMDDTGIYSMYSSRKSKPMYIIQFDENSTELVIQMEREKFLRNPAFDTIFKGVIKNKSELIKLLKQIGLNE